MEIVQNACEAAPLLGAATQSTELMALATLLTRIDARLQLLEQPGLGSTLLARVRDSVVGISTWCFQRTGNFARHWRYGLLATYVLYNHRKDIYRGVEWLYQQSIKEDNRMIILRPFVVDALSSGGGPESLVSGSQLRDVNGGMPTSMGMIAVSEPSTTGKLEFRPIGNFVRVNDSLFMPKHLLEVGPVWLVPNAEANRRANKAVLLDNLLEYNLDDPLTHGYPRLHTVDNDLARLELPVDQLSILGVSKASCAPCPVGGEVEVTAFSRALSRASGGKVTQGMAFGVLEYSGSTTKGFSGGVYTAGNRVVGMHYYGNPNRGYAAAYLDILSKIGRPESTEDWIKKELRTQRVTMQDLKKSGRLKLAENSIEYYYVDLAGKYNIIDRQVVNDVLDAMQDDEHGYDDQYDDGGPEGLVPPLANAINQQVNAALENLMRGSRSQGFGPLARRRVLQARRVRAAIPIPLPRLNGLQPAPAPAPVLPPQ